MTCTEPPRRLHENNLVVKPQTAIKRLCFPIGNTALVTHGDPDAAGFLFQQQQRLTCP